jgi:C-terminal processing protease CtpA/Prc
VDIPEETFDVAWLERVLAEAVAVVRETGLNSEALVDPREELPGPGPFTESEARRFLNAAIRRAHHHNRVFLPKDFESINEDATRPPNDLPTGRLDPSGVAVIRVPGLSAVDGTGVAGTAYSTALDSAVRALDASAVGWVFDLADNDGGNMHPMVAGLVGVLGTGRLCGFRDREGTVTWVEASDTDVRIGSNVLAAVPNAQPVRARPTAVVVGPVTASSGEWTALALASRCSGRLFGQPTGGYLTGVEIKPLPSGAAVGVTGVDAVDHTGRHVADALVPHVECDPTDLSEAIRWVAGAAAFAR